MQAMKRMCAFARADHRYVFLGTSALAAAGLALSQCNPTPSSVLARTGLFQDALWVMLWAWLAVSAVALIYKLTHWDTYRSRAPFVRPRQLRAARIGSYAITAIVLAFFLDRAILGFVDLAVMSAQLTSNPSAFVPSLIYMLWNSRDMFAQGIGITVSLAVFGTIIAFVLSLLMVFLRIQSIDRGDNDLARFLKVVGSGFTKLYSTVVRGTPMMVQGMLVYYAGFFVLRGAFGMETEQANALWSPFVAGLVTVSLNSTAYMMEVLRGGIEAVDPGQAEAARSLGLSQWQAMMRVVFPQGVKNAIPALSNELIINIKDSSVLSVMGVFDLMNATNTVAGAYYRQMEVYCVALVAYLLLTLIAGRLLTMLARRLEVAAPATLPSSN